MLYGVDGLHLEQGDSLPGSRVSLQIPLETRVNFLLSKLQWLPLAGLTAGVGDIPSAMLQ